MLKRQRKVLIISHSDDTSAGIIVKALKKRGIPCIRIDSDNFLNYSTMYRSASDWEIRTPRKEVFRPHEIQSAWLRRVSTPLNTQHLQTLDAEVAQVEGRATLNGLISVLQKSGIRVIDPYPERALADLKIFQHEAAHEAGFRVPETLITNNPGRAADFCATPSINKTLDIQAVRDGEFVYSLSTKQIRKSEVENFPKLVPTHPNFFQRLIPKMYEYRAYFIQGRIIAARISSHDSIDYRVRLRKDEPARAKIEPVTLRAQIVKKIHALMRRLKLTYGALDLIETPDQQTYFLECGTAASFYWMPTQIREEIEDAVIEMLTKQRYN